MIEITIPQYIEKYKLSNKAIRRFYKESSKTPLPEKYASRPEKYIYKKGKLFDVEKKDFITKNTGTVGKPRWKAISANNVWSKMHEHERMKMIDQIKADFRPHFEPHRAAFKELKYPILVECDLYSLPKYCDWDLSNLWVYNKVLEDLIKEDNPDEVQYLTERNPNRIPAMGLIPDDSILYITKPATPRFLPVTREEERRMVFKFYQDNHPMVKSHLMYNLQIKTPQYFSYPVSNLLSAILFSFTKDGSTGTYLIDMDTTHIALITANVGKKKIIAGEVSTALNRLYWDCINMNSGIIMIEEQFKEFESYIEKFLLNRGIPVYVHRAFTLGSSQEAT